MQHEDPLRIFIGYDHRQPIALNVLQQSIYARSTKPVAITPLVLPQLPLKRQGLTPFTFSRFLVPYLCGFKGWALFLDLDMVVVDDISKLFELADDKYSVMVVKNKMQFEWASVMLFNCAKCQKLVPEYIENADRLHIMDWVEDKEKIGSLPHRWNHLVGYDEPNDDVSLIHYTQGVPCFNETNDSEHTDVWMKEHQLMNSATSWVDLMGNSVHATKIKGKLVPKYKAKKELHKPIAENESNEKISASA